MGFEYDTSEPVPGPYRAPYEHELRTRIHLENHWQDCTTVAEVNPDLAQHTDATVRLLAASWSMKELLEEILGYMRDYPHEPLGGGVESYIEEVLNYIKTGSRTNKDP